MAATRSCICARQVRHDAQQPLDQHELPAVVHLVLLGAQQHFEPGFAGRLHALRGSHLLAQEIFRQSLQQLRELLALRAQHADDLRLRTPHLFLGAQRAKETEEVEPIQRGSPFDDVYLLVETRRHRDMHQRLRHGSRLGCGPEAVVLLGNVLGYGDGVLPYRAKALSEFFRSVVVHPCILRGQTHFPQYPRFAVRHTPPNGSLEPCPGRVPAKALREVENLHDEPPPDAEKANRKINLSCVLPCGATLMGANGVPAKLSRGLLQPHSYSGLRCVLALESIRDPDCHFHARGCRVGAPWLELSLVC